MASYGKRMLEASRQNRKKPLLPPRERVDRQKRLKEWLLSEAIPMQPENAQISDIEDKESIEPSGSEYQPTESSQSIEDSHSSLPPFEDVPGSENSCEDSNSIVFPMLTNSNDASYGKRMLEASRQNRKKPLLPPRERVDRQKRLKEWLLSEAIPMQPENAQISDIEDKESIEPSGSEYQPTESSQSIEDSHSSLPPFEDVPGSENSCEDSNSIVFPMLTNSNDDSNRGQCSKTPLDSQIRNAFKNVTVAGGPRISATGKRNYSKPDYCLYCKNRYTSKISSHYLAVHSTEPNVIAITELPTGSKERKRRLTLLQNEGNHLHNLEVLRNGCGEITVNRRSTESSRSDAYLPCTECKAWVLETSLSIHSRSCAGGKSIDSNLSRNSKMLISPFITLDTDDAEIEDLIMKMKETSKHPGLKRICQTDQLIKEFCRGLLHKLGPDNEQRRKDKDNIRTKLRAVGRLLISLNQRTKQELDLSAYMSPKSFMLVVKTVNAMGQATPNLALTLGHYIKQICQLKRSLALQSENEMLKRESDNFDLLLGAHWNNYVSAVTLRRLKLRTLNKTIELPKKDDMVKLKDFLDHEISESLKRPKPNLQQWSEACQSLMVRILLFNKRRVAEVEELKVADILHVQNMKDNEEILAQMDITEKALARRMSVVEVRGKSTRGLRKVFVILSEQMMQACQHLIQTRMYVGIDQSNEYLFARPGGSALDGCKAMRDITSKCPGLECPHLIRTRLLRKYLATTIQLLDMTGDELKMVADHMGHSVTVHTDVYRLQASVLEKTKVARALIALENGQLGKFAGKNLSSCSFEDLPMPLFEEEDNIDTLATIDEVVETDNEALSETSIPVANEITRKSALVGSQNKSSPQKQTKIQKRKRWDAEEESNIMAAFSNHIVAKRNPSGAEIKTAQQKYPLLKRRSVVIIRSKVNNIILGKCKRNLTN